MALELFQNKVNSLNNQHWVLVTLIELRNVSSDQDSYYELNDAFITVGVPKDLRKTICNILKHLKLIDIGTSSKPLGVSRINAEGLKYIEDKTEEQYQKNIPMTDASIIDMPLSDIKQLIFELHIKNGGVLSWNKGTFDRQNIPRLAEIAKAQMLQSGMIFQNPTGIHPRTILHEDVMSCASFIEANKVLSEKRDKPFGHTVTMGDGSINMIDSHIRDLDFQPTIKPPTTPIIAEPKQGRINSIIAFTLRHIVLVLTLAVVGGLILAYIKDWFGLTN